MQKLAVLTALFCLPLAALAQINAGFVQGLWYSDDPFFADEEVRVYVALRNNADGDLTGVVRFLDNGELIDERHVSALEGKVVDTWVDWTPEAGAHKIEALLTDVVLDGDEERHATVTYALAEDIRIVDYDTDGDGVGNEEDADDDGDGFLDEEELLNGTDPLVFDEEVLEETGNESDENGGGGDGGSDESGNGGSNDGNSESDDESNSGDENGSAGESGNGSDRDEKEGFETFLDDGVTKTALGGITSISNSIKNTIDALRSNRAERKRAEEEAEQKQNKTSGADEKNDEDNQTESGTSTPNTQSGTGATDDVGTATNTTSRNARTGEHDSSIGEVTRSVGDLDGIKNTIDIVGILRSILDAAYGGVLLILSLYFAYPGIVQFTLLFLILLLIYHFSRKLAKRPQD